MPPNRLTTKMEVEDKKIPISRLERLTSSCPNHVILLVTRSTN